MEVKHTPAPWDIERSKDGADSWYLYGQFAEAPIAEIACWMDDHETGIFQSAESEANANLLKAAPNLLEACIAMIEWDDREKDHAVDFGARMALCNAAFQKARDAIAKAGAA